MIKAFLRWFINTIPLELFSLTAYVVVPLAYVLPKTFNWYLDDEIKTGIDYKIWSQGRKDNFATFYKWHANRNRMWNLRRKFYIDTTYIIIDKVIKNTLTRNGSPVNANQTASFKWIDKFGNEGWQVNSGVKVSKKYSTVGINFILFSVGKKKYFRFSLAKKYFNKYYITIKLGTNDKRNIITFKKQTEK